MVAKMVGDSTQMQVLNTRKKVVLKCPDPSKVGDKRSRTELNEGDDDLSLSESDNVTEWKIGCYKINPSTPSGI